MTKLLVASESDGKSTVQIFNLDQEKENLICDNLPNFFIGGFDSLAGGQLLNGNQPIICKCYNCAIFQNGQWKSKPSFGHSCRIAGGSTILTNSEGKEVFSLFYPIEKTLYLATFDGSDWNSQETDFNFDENLCIVKINSSVVMFIEGSKGGNTYFYNAQINKLTPGPFLKTPRYDLICGILTWRNPGSNDLENMVVAAGGIKNDLNFDSFNKYSQSGYMSSVELLYLNDEGINKGEWISGPELPNASSDAMVEYDNSLIIFDDNAMYQLSSPVGPWVEMKQKLKGIDRFRGGSISFLVPDEIVNCS